MRSLPTRGAWIEIICRMTCDTTALTTEQGQLLDEMALLADMVEASMVENATVALDQKDYRKRHDSLVEKYEKAEKKYKEVTEKIEEIGIRSQRLQQFKEALSKLKGEITEFDEGLWGTLVDFITVLENGTRTVTFRNGTKI